MSKFKLGTVARFVETFDSISDEVHKNAVEKGFWSKDQDSDGLKIAHIHSEVSEMFEGLREGNPESEKIPGFSKAEEEAADVLLKTMDLCKKRGWRLAEAIIAKHFYNTKRPQNHDKKF